MDELEKYYQYLKSKGADVPPSIESFRTTLSDEKEARTYYDYVRSKGFDAPDTYDSFINTFGLKKKEQPLQDSSTISATPTSPSPLPQDGIDVKKEAAIFETQNPDHSEYDSYNPIDLAKQADELSKRQNIVGVSGGTGGAAANLTVDTEAIAESQKIIENLKKRGFDKDAINKTFSDFDESWYQVEGFSKDQLAQDIIDNPLKAQRKIATGKWYIPLMLNARDKGEDVVQLQNLINTAQLEDATYEQKRATNQKLYQIIATSGAPNTDKMLENFAIDHAYAYGTVDKNNSELQKRKEQFPNLNENHILAFDYLSDVSPDKAYGFEAALIDPKLLKDNFDAQRGQEEKLKRLEELGISLQENTIKEKLKTFENTANKLLENVVATVDELPPDERAMWEDIQKYTQPLQQQLEEINKQKNNLLIKYPKAGVQDAQLFAQELLGQKNTGLNWFALETGSATSSAAQSVFDLVSTPFASEMDLKMRQNEILGDEMGRTLSTNLTQDKQTTKTFEPTLAPELKQYIEELKADKTLTEEQKSDALTIRLMRNPDQWRRTPIEGGKSNIGLTSLLYGTGQLAAFLAPFVLAETATGGGATASFSNKFKSTFTSMMATSYHEALSHAIDSGVQDPYSHAMRVTAINSAAMAGAGTPAAIRKLLSGSKSAAGDLIMKMTDDEILKVLNKETSTLSAFRKSLNIGKNAGKNVLGAAKEGTLTAAKIQPFITGGQVLNDAIDGNLQSAEDYMKQAAIEGLKFSIMGSATGIVGRILKPQNELTKASLYEAGANPKEFLAALEQKIKNNAISKTEADQVKANIEKAEEVFKKVPFVDSKGREMSERQRRDLLFLKMQENELNETLKKDIPENLVIRTENQLAILKEKIENLYKGKFEEENTAVKTETSTTEEPIIEVAEETQGTLGKVKNAENINVEELSKAENDLYNLLEKNPEAAHLIEPLILEIQNYPNEFKTKTEVSTVTEKVPVEGTYAAKSKIEIKPALEQSAGSEARITTPDGNTVKGTLNIKSGQYVLDVPQGTQRVIGEKAITDRDLKLPSEEKVENPIELDADGNVKSVTFETKDGNLITIENPEKALDIAIQLKVQEIGEIPDGVFEKAYQEVAREVKKEVLVTTGEVAIESKTESVAPTPKSDVATTTSEKKSSSEPPPPKEPPKEEGAGGKKQMNDKGVLTHLAEAKNIPAESKKGFEEKGLKYEPQSREEAEQIGKSMVDQYGIEDAVLYAEGNRFKGGVNSAIFAESLNRLYKQETEAKTPEEKLAAAQKFAEIGIRYDEFSRGQGRDISQIAYFYKKSPLGIQMMENAKRREEFENWAKPKEKSWKEVFEDMMKEPEFETVVKEEVRTAMKKERAEARAARIKKVDEVFDKAINQFKGGAAYSTIIPPQVIQLALKGMKEAYHAGEKVAKLVEDAIDYISKEMKGASWDKEKFRKEWNERLHDPAEKKGLTDEELKSRVLERFRKKMKGLTDKQKEEVVTKSFKKIVDSGGLDYADFRKIISDVTGRGEMTEAEATKFRELVAKTNAVEDAAKKAREDRTQEARQKFRQAQIEASSAERELNIILSSRPNIMKRLTSMLQLNTLGIAALVNNPIYNLWNQVTLRAPVGLVKTVIDQTIFQGGKLFGKNYRPETNVLRTQREFFNKLGLGSREAIGQFVSGLNRMDYTQKEVYGQQIRPIEAMKDLWAFHKGEKNLSKKQVFDKILQALPQGWSAEIIARTLNLGDKPQRFAAEGSQASAFAKSLGLKDIDYDLFVDFPREEAYRVYKQKGLTDAEAGKKADYIRDTIIKEGERSTFQQDNFVNDLLNKIFGGKDSGVGGFLKSAVISPYIKIPTNAYWSYFNIVNPEVAMLQSMIYGAKAYMKRNGDTKFNFDKSNSTAAKDLNESKYWLAHAAVGFATRAVVVSLVGAGIFRSSNTGEDTKKEREGEQNYEQQGTVNVSKLLALVKGEDPSQVKNGLLIQNRWFGHWGSVGNTIARREEEMTPEQKENREGYWTEMLGRMDDAGVKELEQGIFANTTSLMSALSGGLGEFNLQRWGANTMSLFANIIHPAAFAQMSKAELPYYTKTKSDTFFGELKNAMLTRSSWLRKLMDEYPPAKIGIWGDKIEKNTSSGFSEKIDALPFLFGVSRAGDDNFAQPIYEDYKRTNNTKFFPSAAMPTIKSGGETIKLSVSEADELATLVGQARKMLIAPYINDMATFEGSSKKYSELTDFEKVDKLSILYETGYQKGKEQFLLIHPEYNIQKDPEMIMEDKRESKENRSLRKAAKGAAATY